MWSPLFVLASTGLLLTVALDVPNDWTKFKSIDKTMPNVDLKKTDDEWKKLTNDNKPKPDNPNAPEIKQPSNSGKTGTYLEKQIVGGNLATIAQFPWQAFIYIDNAWLCGGSLILSQWVLTAGHCGGNNYQIGLGTINQTYIPFGGYYLSTNISFVHEQYNNITLVNDIALIKLASPIAFTSNVIPIKLPPMSDATKDLTGILATVSGYGKTSDGASASIALKYTQVTVISYAQCASYYGTSTVVSTTICTFQNQTSTCQGDSGGPLIYKDSNNTWVQIGVVSFGAAAGCLVGPSGFTRVSSYLGWMSGKIGQDMSGTTVASASTTTTTTTTTTTKPTTTTTKPTTTTTKPTTTTTKPTTTTTKPTTTTTKPTTTTTKPTTTTTKPTTTTTKPTTTTTKPTTTSTKTTAKKRIAG